MSGDNAEIANAKTINALLKEDFLCCPPYNSINGGWVRECFRIINEDKKENLKYLVTKEIISPSRRAYQTTYFYRELDIFKPFVYILDVATICFLEGNWICSYLSILPVIEGVLKQWQLEADIKDGKGIKALCKEIFELVLSKYDLKNNFYNYLKLQCDFLHEILRDDFFEHGDKIIEKNPEQNFGRNIALHMSKIPKYSDSGLNVARLFLILDIISKLYLHSRPDKYAYLGSSFDYNFKDELYEKYFDLYKKCASAGMYSSHINRLHNTIYENELTSIGMPS